MSSPRFVTIGVYGRSETEFFAALAAAQVDTFCDIRQRRGVRGAEYAFVNSQRLQARLAELGIRYCYVKELAPTEAIRQAQAQADKAEKIAKRQRTALGPAFAEAYRREVLSAYSPQELLAQLPVDAKVVALFCVERAPEACHRHLVADALVAAGLDVEHVR